MSRLWSNSPDLTGGYPNSAGYVFGSPTSRAAAQRIRKQSESLEDVVLSLLTVAGERGLTDFELQAAAEREGIHSLMRPRRATLTARGEVVDSGVTRAAPSGLMATVWVRR